MIEKPAHADSLNGGNTGFRDGDIYTYVKMQDKYYLENKYLILYGEVILVI